MTSSAELFWRLVDKDGPIPDQSDRKVSVPTPCWIWTGSKTEQGYGQVRRSGKTYRAHRYAYELINRKIPQGLVLDHLCRNKSCVRPDHLEAVKQRENISRGILRDSRLARTSCKRGHEYAIGSYRNVETRTGVSRKCKICEADYNRARYSSSN